MFLGQIEQQIGQVRSFIEFTSVAAVTVRRGSMRMSSGIGCAMTGHSAGRKLIGAQSQVSQDAVDGRDARGGEHFTSSAKLAWNRRIRQGGLKGRRDGTGQIRGCAGRHRNR